MLTLLLNDVHIFIVFQMSARTMKIAVNSGMRLEPVAGCTPSILRAMITTLMCTVTWNLMKVAGW